MGYVLVPEQAHEGRNFATLELDRAELQQTLTSLQNVLLHLSNDIAKGNKISGAKAAPAPYNPVLVASQRSSNRVGSSEGNKLLPAVNVITPSVAALQQRLGVDVSVGLSVGFDSVVPRPATIGSLTAVGSRDRDGVVPYNPEKFHRAIGRPRSAVEESQNSRRLGGLADLVPQTDFRNATAEVLESSLRLLGIGDEVEDSGHWRSRLLEDTRTGASSLMDELASPRSLARPDPSRVAKASGIWDPPRIQLTEGSFSDRVKNSAPITGSLNPVLGFGTHSSIGSSVKYPPLQAPVFHAGTATQTRKESFSGIMHDSSQGLVAHASELTYRPGFEGINEKLNDTEGARRSLAVNARQGSVVTPSSSAHVSGNAWQSGIDIEAQARKTHPGVQAETVRSTFQSQSDPVKFSESSSGWRSRWTTSAAEHNRECVTGMLCIPVVEGLEGGEAFSGWLVSSSRRILNLWECTSYTSPSDPALQVMHSQATEFNMESIDVDAPAQIFLGFGSHPRDQGHCISLHSLAATSFFTYKGMIRVPDNSLPLRKQGFTSGARFCHVNSLQPLGGPLRSSLAAAIGSEVYVYELSAAGMNPLLKSQPKATWKAHSGPISAMHRSSFACALFTGATDGLVRLWDLKTKPSAPVRQYSHAKQVTQICMLDSNTVGSCGADGVINIWDIRSSGAAVFSANPDKTSVTSLAVNVLTKTVACTTRKGVYCVELAAQGGLAAVTLSPAVPLPAAGPCVDLNWNTRTNQLYACGLDGSINVFCKT